MALSNWDTLAFDEKGEPTAGEMTSPMGVLVEIYKNWCYVRDDKAWREGAYTGGVIAEVKHGSCSVFDVQIYAERGPQNGIYIAAIATQYPDAKKGKEEKFVGLLGCGVYGYFCEDWVGVEGESFEFLKGLVKRADDVLYGVPDAWKTLEREKAKRYNQGNAYFTMHLGTPLDATAPGEANPKTTMQQLTDVMFKKDEKK